VATPLDFAVRQSVAASPSTKMFDFVDDATFDPNIDR